MTSAASFQTALEQVLTGRRNVIAYMDSECVEVVQGDRVWFFDRQSGSHGTISPRPKAPRVEVHHA